MKRIIAIMAVTVVSLSAGAATIFQEDFDGTLNDSVSSPEFSSGGQVISTLTPDVGASWSTLVASSTAPQTYYGGGLVFIDSADPEAGAAGNTARGGFASTLSLGTDIVTISGTVGGLTGASGSGYGIYVGFLDSSQQGIPQNGASPGVYFRDMATSVLYGTGTTDIAQKAEGGNATFASPTGEFTYAFTWNTVDDTLSLDVNGSTILSGATFTPSFSTIDSFAIGFRQTSYDNSDSSVLGSGAYHKSVTVTAIP
jgi:hypothetical protein